MKITFIEPAPPGFHIYSFIKQVRMGLPLLATMIRDAGHDVVVLAESLSEIDWQRVMSSDLVGVSTITSTAIKAYRYAERAREAGATVVMGGPHVTFEPDEALEFSDYVVRGEGEDTIFELLEHLENGRPADSIAGLSYHNGDGRHVHNPSRPLREKLSDLPVPDLSLIREHEKIYPMPLLTSRGCPQDCEFCSVVQMFGRRIRFATPQWVTDAIRSARPDKIFFYDDNFFITKKRGKELLVSMIREGVSTSFSAQIRVDTICKNGKVDHEILHLLREAGCDLVYMGLESTNPETLAAFNKRQSVDDIRGGIDALHSYGIRTHGMFVFGSDFDTPESLMQTVDFAIEHDITSVQFLALTPIPGTRQHAQFEREGRIFTRNWSLYDGHHVVYWPKKMSPYELMQVILKAHHRFYSLRRIPDSFKFRAWGFLIGHGWERVPENMAYMRELKAFCATHSRPASMAAASIPPASVSSASVSEVR